MKNSTIPCESTYIGVVFPKNHHYSWRSCISTDCIKNDQKHQKTAKIRALELVSRAHHHHHHWFPLVDFLNLGWDCLAGWYILSNSSMKPSLFIIVLHTCRLSRSSIFSIFVHVRFDVLMSKRACFWGESLSILTTWPIYFKYCTSQKFDIGPVPVISYSCSFEILNLQSNSPSVCSWLLALSLCFLFLCALLLSYPPFTIFLKNPFQMVSIFFMSAVLGSHIRRFR